jgi:mannose/cellobiose epimerase-like protein (N-acyl-D-glucosamine 2-epimerase family)
MSHRTRTLFEPGHEAEWAAINREEEEQERASTMALSPPERIKAGQKLSQQAVALLASSIRAGHAPRRAYWS